MAIRPFRYFLCLAWPTKAAVFLPCCAVVERGRRDKSSESLLTLLWDLTDDNGSEVKYVVD